MAHHQHDTNRQAGGLHGLFRRFYMNAPTVPAEGEEDVVAEADEPPDDQISPLHTTFDHHDLLYKKFSRPAEDRRESLLTRALMGEPGQGDVPSHPHASQLSSRGMSTSSMHSSASMASTAELTSDTGVTSPPRSATPSPPPPPPATHTLLLVPTKPVTEPSNPVLKTEAHAVGRDPNEAAVEKTLGRKRCIMFACGNTSDKAKETLPEPKQEVPAVEPPKRKCTLRFACPSREDSKTDLASEALTRRSESSSTKQQRSSSPVSPLSQAKKPTTTTTSPIANALRTLQPQANAPIRDIDEHITSTLFHEFATSSDEPDAWVNKPTDHQPKLTMTDCMKKENAIRQIGEEAEEEAELEEAEADELGEESDNDENEDDFAPSDRSSDAGNESDDENGFAESDDDSDAESDYQFWAPSKAPSMTTATTSVDNLPISHIRSSHAQRQSLASSPDSGPADMLPAPYTQTQSFRQPSKRRSPKFLKMRPSTPELPDSTDFVCGTLDEDRPLEAAYISCREQKKREKHILVPQDIDPSFPTTDPENNDDDDDDDDDANDLGPDEEEDQLWLKGQLDGFEDDSHRGRRKSSTAKPPQIASPRKLHSPPPRKHIHRLVLSRQNSNRSPPPKHQHRRPSPAPRRLFGHSPTRLRSPPPNKLRSPPGSPTARGAPLGITITRLAQRPNAGRTASLPHTPNPFFRDYKLRSPQLSRFNSGETTPAGLSEIPDRDRHVRGAVDIVIGLEKKRQKRKEKFWRQHSRRAAKEQAERKPLRGRGVERMKELGLECAERTKGYGLGQPAQLVLSL